MGGLLKQVAQVTPGGEHSLFQEAVSMFCCFSSCGIIGEGFLHPLRLGAVALTVEWLPADLPRKTGALCKRVLGEVGRHPLWHCSEPPTPASPAAEWFQRVCYSSLLTILLVTSLTTSFHDDWAFGQGDGSLRVGSYDARMVHSMIRSG